MSRLALNLLSTWLVFAVFCMPQLTAADGERFLTELIPGEVLSEAELERFTGRGVAPSWRVLTADAAVPQALFFKPLPKFKPIRSASREAGFRAPRNVVVELPEVRRALAFKPLPEFKPVARGRRDPHINLRSPQPGAEARRRFIPSQALNRSLATSFALTHR